MKIDFLLNIIKQPSILLSRDHKEVAFLKKSQQSAKAFVEKAYQRTFELLAKQLSSSFPRHEIINDSSKAAPTESFIYLNPIEGKDNMISGLPFFGTLLLISSRVGLVRYETALINLPCFDLSIFCQSSSYTIVQDLAKGRTRASISVSGDITLTACLSADTLKLPQVELGNLRATGSRAYSLALFLQGQARRLILNRQDLYIEKVADLLVTGAGGIRQDAENQVLYSA